jgi:hypothetical protein
VTRQSAPHPDRYRLVNHQQKSPTFSPRLHERIAFLRPRAAAWRRATPPISSRFELEGSRARDTSMPLGSWRSSRTSVLL